MNLACNHSPNLVGPNFCKHTSGVPARAGACVGCPSPHKVTNITPVDDPEDGLPSAVRRFEGLGVTVLSSQHSAANFSATGGGTQAGKVASEW